MSGSKSPHLSLRPPALAVCLLALAATALLSPRVAAAADLNASPSNLSSVYASAQGGDVIHLASGNYGSFGGGSKSSVVTLVAQSGATATISPNLGTAVNNLRFDGLTIDGAYTNGVKNVAFVNSKFTGLVRVDTPANISNANVLFDHDTFDGLNATASSYEGRLTVRGYDNSSPVGVKITNSHFGNGGCSDGVQVIGGAYGVQIGPGNEISGIKQASCSNHVDSIQLYGSSHTQIVGNYFHDADTVIMAPDGGDQENITDNVMLGSGYVSAVQLGSQDGTVFRHNTVKNIQVQTGSKVGGSASRNVVVQDNAFAQGADLNPDQGSGCSSCPTSYNLFATSNAASGTNAQVGAPVFSGGATPSSYSGYALASNSPGKANASDGADRGIRVSGATQPPPPPPATDATAPDTTITSDPATTTTSTNASFAFASSESGSTFECKLDAGAYGACTSPKAYSGLATGSHTFSVRATDAAGNTDASPASWSWTIQAASPADHQPVAAYSDSPTTPRPGQAVTFDASSATCQDTPCSYTWVDDGPDGPGGGQWPLGNGRTMTFTFQEAGVKNVRMTVTDGDGDTATIAKAVTVSAAAPSDTTPPETTITSGPTGTTNDNTPTFAFSSSESGSTFQCRVDSGSWASCASPWTTSALSDGSHSVSVRATDAAGNTDASPATGSFTVSTAVAGQNLLGSSAVQSAADRGQSGSAEAFLATATGSGKAVSLSVYVDAGNSATNLITGIYSDANGHPGTLLSKGSLNAPRAGSWNKVTIPATALTSGKPYWIALMGTGGGLSYRDGAGASNCHSETSRSQSLTTLPTTWSGGASWASCPLSGYAAS